MMTSKKCMQELKAGKQIRIKYNKQWDDCCDGWWSEELWSYDPNIDLYKCHYPVSSYGKEFFTIHKYADVEFNLRETMKDFEDRYQEKIVVDIIIEESNTPTSSLSLEELAHEKIKSMTYEELKNFLAL